MVPARESEGHRQEQSVPPMFQSIKLSRARSTGSGCCRIHWVIEARKLSTQDKQVVSPQFDLDLPGLGATPFKLAIFPKSMSDGRGAGGFRKSLGRGRVELKCEAPLRRSPHPVVTFRIGIGDDETKALRGPVSHNFSDRSCCGLPKNMEEWDFASVVNAGRNFTVRLVVSPLEGARDTF